MSTVRNNPVRSPVFKRDAESPKANRIFKGMSISIFARKSRSHQRDGHLWRVSSIIRGWQIAEAIGAKINPEKDYQNDVCIYVKPHVKPGNDFNFEGKPYLDIIDGWQLLPLASKHPEVTVITSSVSDFEYVCSLIDNKVILIPQHHCNFERKKRTRNKVERVGCIGSPQAFDYLPNDLKPELANRGIELYEFWRFFTREDVVNFYLSIDFQIVWRPYGVKMSNPLKLVNAASFGIPTIALDERTFAEMEGCYLPVKSLNEFLAKLDKLRSSPKLYSEYSERCLEIVEKYHIDNIAKLYKNLV